MAVISLALVVLLIASGGAFERITNRPFRFAAEPESTSDVPEDEQTGEDGDPPSGVDKYMSGVRRYADVAVSAMVVIAALGFGVTQLMGWGEERRVDDAARRVAISKAGQGDGGQVAANDEKRVQIPPGWPGAPFPSTSQLP